MCDDIEKRIYNLENITEQNRVILQKLSYEISRNNRIEVIKELIIDGFRRVENRMAEMEYRMANFEMDLNMLRERVMEYYINTDFKFRENILIKKKPVDMN